MLKATKKRRKPIKGCKPNADFAEALLERFGDLWFLSSSDARRLFLEQAAVLYSRVGNKQRFLRYLEQFIDEAGDEGSLAFKVGYYIRERLKAKRLPKLEKYTDPRWWSTE